jgi:hypothetical protein
MSPSPPPAASPPALDSDPDTPPLLASPPGWAEVPSPPPSPTRPDQLPPGAVTGPAKDGAPSGSPGSTPESPRLLASRGKAYAAIARAALMAAGGWLNKLAAIEGIEDESFLPDDDDLADIPPPLGRLAARRIKLGDIENLSDIEDVGMALVGIAAWLAKGVSSAWEVRRELRRALAEQPPAEPGGQ